MPDPRTSGRRTPPSRRRTAPQFASRRAACIALWLAAGWTCRPALALEPLAGPLVLEPPTGPVLAPPTGPVVLELRGRVQRRNQGDCACFDMAMLAALPQTSFSAHAPWYAQPHRFTGPLLRELLAAAGAQGSRLQLRALNDYRVELPRDDAERHGPIVARLLDGAPLTVRDKGPLLLIYPFDDDPDLRSPLYFSRSAWQLRTITVD